MFLLVKYQEIAGRDNLVEMINELLYFNKKRPAFVEELNYLL